MIAFMAPGWKVTAIAHNLAEKLGLNPNPLPVPRSTRVTLNQPATAWVDALDGSIWYRAEVLDKSPDNVARLRKAIEELGFTIKPYPLIT